MRKILCLTSAMVLLAGCAATMDKKMAAKSGAHTHMGHVTTGWKDTPGRKGLLPTAIIEAKITQKHAGFASNKMGNLAWMKTHIGHVLHTIDPGVERKGPGLGYGVVKAAGGARKHVGFAAADKSASKNVKTHAKHVKASTKNVVTWSKLIVRLGKKVKKAKSAAQAAPMVKKIKQLAARLTKGDDANGDGKVSWGPGEGGLDSATQHMGFMKKGEGL